jgi:hypothetical protein
MRLFVLVLVALAAVTAAVSATTATTCPAGTLLSFHFERPSTIQQPYLTEFGNIWSMAWIEDGVVWLVHSNGTGTFSDNQIIQISEPIEGEINCTNPQTIHTPIASAVTLTVFYTCSRGLMYRTVDIIYRAKGYTNTITAVNIPNYAVSEVQRLGDGGEYQFADWYVFAQELESTRMLRYLFLDQGNPNPFVFVDYDPPRTFLLHGLKTVRIANKRPLSIYSPSNRSVQAFIQVLSVSYLASPIVEVNILNNTASDILWMDVHYANATALIAVAMDQNVTIVTSIDSGNTWNGTLNWSVPPNVQYWSLTYTNKWIIALGYANQTIMYTNTQANPVSVWTMSILSDGPTLITSSGGALMSGEIHSLQATFTSTSSVNLTACAQRTPTYPPSMSSWSSPSFVFTSPLVTPTDPILSFSFPQDECLDQVFDDERSTGLNVTMDSGTQCPVNGDGFQAIRRGFNSSINGALSNSFRTIARDPFVTWYDRDITQPERADFTIEIWFSSHLRVPAISGYSTRIFSIWANRLPPKVSPGITPVLLMNYARDGTRHYLDVQNVGMIKETIPMYDDTDDDYDATDSVRISGASNMNQAIESITSGDGQLVLMTLTCKRGLDHDSHRIPIQVCDVYSGVQGSGALSQVTRAFDLHFDSSPLFLFNQSVMERVEFFRLTGTTWSEESLPGEIYSFNMWNRTMNTLEVYDRFTTGPPGSVPVTLNTNVIFAQFTSSPSVNLSALVYEEDGDPFVLQIMSIPIHGFVYINDTLVESVPYNTTRDVLLRYEPNSANFSILSNETTCDSSAAFGTVSFRGADKDGVSPRLGNVYFCVFDTSDPPLASNLSLATLRLGNFSAFTLDEQVTDADDYILPTSPTRLRDGSHNYSSLSVIEFLEVNGTFGALYNSTCTGPLTANVSYFPTWNNATQKEEFKFCFVTQRDNGTRWGNDSFPYRVYDQGSHASNIAFIQTMVIEPLEACPTGTCTTISEENDPSFWVNLTVIDWFDSDRELLYQLVELPTYGSIYLPNGTLVDSQRPFNVSVVRYMPLEGYFNRNGTGDFATLLGEGLDGCVSFGESCQCTLATQPGCPDTFTFRAIAPDGTVSDLVQHILYVDAQYSLVDGIRSPLLVNATVGALIHMNGSLVVQIEDSDVDMYWIGVELTATGGYVGFFELSPLEYRNTSKYYWSECKEGVELTFCTRVRVFAPLTYLNELLHSLFFYTLSRSSLTIKVFKPETVSFGADGALEDEAAIVANVAKTATTFYVTDTLASDVDIAEYVRTIALILAIVVCVIFLVFFAGFMMVYTCTAAWCKTYCNL